MADDSEGIPPLTGERFKVLADQIMRCATRNELQALIGQIFSDYGVGSAHYTRELQATALTDLQMFMTMKWAELDGIDPK